MAKDWSALWPFPVPQQVPEAIDLKIKLPPEVHSIADKLGEAVYWAGVRDGAFGASVSWIAGILFCFVIHSAARGRMSKGFAATALAGLLAIVLWYGSSRPQQHAPAAQPPTPNKPADPEPKRKGLRPRGDQIDQAQVEGRRRPRPEPLPGPEPPDDPKPGPDGRRIQLGGPVSPDGSTQVVCDLPLELRTKNIVGRDGAGLCVFASIGHAARWQHEPVLEDFRDFMRRHPGGGHPEKVDRMVAAIAKARQVDPPAYVQYEGQDPGILEAAMKTGRMVSVTYGGRDPHYGNRTIAHMVNLVAFDDAWAAILDNNFIGENDLVWLPRNEFLKRWQQGGGGGWAVILLAPPPPPPPRN